MGGGETERERVGRETERKGGRLRERGRPRQRGRLRERERERERDRVGGGGD